MSASTIPRLASTVIVARDRDGALEVLMLRRSMQASFMPGAHVFPGGALDAADASEETLLRCNEPEDIAARRLCQNEGARAQAVAALRECFEECGLWLGVDAPLDAERMARARKRLHAGTVGIGELSRELDLPLAITALAPWSHWVTPIDLPKRFDTRFYVASAPQGQEATSDAGETTSVEWVRPADALARLARGDFPMEFATQRTMLSIAAFEHAAALLAHASRPREIVAIHPRIAIAGDGKRRLLPEDHAYAEVMRVDPEGTGTARCTIDPGHLVRLAPAVARITAPNAGMMTGPGTNSYLIGRDGDYAVIDPGPAIDSHIEALMKSTSGRIAALLITHTHVDHSPAAQKLAEITGARRIGIGPPPSGPQDRDFVPDHEPADGETIRLAGCELQAIRTPGHASNHVCWWLDEEKMLFTGDHLMQGSTVVINPPDGDMLAYLESLRALPQRLPALEWLAPGHGFLVDRPRVVIERLIAHRLAREAKVAAALERLGEAGEEQLLEAVYDDVPAHLHRVAARSLLAHLLKLQSERRAIGREGSWRKA